MARKEIKNKLITHPIKKGQRTCSALGGYTTGVYHLLLHLHRPERNHVGGLGLVDFPPGYYIYTGRAGRGLNQRLNRHLKKRKKRHWHIDYLIAVVETKAILISGSTAAAECRKHRAIMRLPGSKVIIPRFGSSDCRCPSHLAFFQKQPREGFL